MSTSPESRRYHDGIASWSRHKDANSHGLTGNDLCAWIVVAGLGVAQAHRVLVPGIGRGRFHRCVRLGTGPLPADVANALSAAMTASAPQAPADTEPVT